MLIAIISILSIMFLSLILFAYYIINKIIHKYAVLLDLEGQSLIHEITLNCVSSGCFFAEQWAHRIQKEIGNKHKVPSADKLIKAVKYIFEDLKVYGISGYSEQEIKDRVESFLGSNTMGLNSIPNFINKEDNDEPNSFLSSD